MLLDGVCFRADEEEKMMIYAYVYIYNVIYIYLYRHRCINYTCDEELEQSHEYETSPARHEYCEEKMMYLCFFSMPEDSC